jgi:hypothetical protein
LLEVVSELLILVSIVDRKFEFSFFGPEDDGLTFHAADHVEGCLRLSTQRHLQQVFLNAGFDGFAQFSGDLKEAVRRAKTFDALMWPLMVVVTDPEPDSFPRRVEALELRTGEELLPNRFPEAFDLAQGHRVMRSGFKVVRAILLHLGLEASAAAPINILPAIVREHLFGRLVLAGSHPKHLQHVFGGVAAEQIGADQEAGIVVHEPDEVGVTAA